MVNEAYRRLCDIYVTLAGFLLINGFSLRGNTGQDVSCRFLSHLVGYGDQV